MASCNNQAKIPSPLRPTQAVYGNVAPPRPITRSSMSCSPPATEGIYMEQPQVPCYSPSNNPEDIFGEQRYHDQAITVCQPHNLDFTPFQELKTEMYPTDAKQQYANAVLANATACPQPRQCKLPCKPTRIVCGEPEQLQAIVPPPSYPTQEQMVYQTNKPFVAPRRQTPYPKQNSPISYSQPYQNFVTPELLPNPMLANVSYTPENYPCAPYLPPDGTPRTNPLVRPGIQAVATDVSNLPKNSWQQNPAYPTRGIDETVTPFAVKPLEDFKPFPNAIEATQPNPYLRKGQMDLNVLPAVSPEQLHEEHLQSDPLGEYVPITNAAAIGSSDPLDKFVPMNSDQTKVQPYLTTMQDLPEDPDELAAALENHAVVLREPAKDSSHEIESETTYVPLGPHPPLKPCTSLTSQLAYANLDQDVGPLEDPLPKPDECMELGYIEKSITCVLCNSIKYNFKMLTCHHYFCTGCLKGLIGGLSPPQSFACPLCEHPEMVRVNKAEGYYAPQFLSVMYHYHHALISKLPVLCSKHQEIELTGACEHAPASVRCCTCSIEFCENCGTDHKHYNPSHCIKTIKAVLLDKIKANQQAEMAICHEHGHKCDWICQPCRKPVCKACCQYGHEGHPKVHYAIPPKANLEEEMLFNQELLIRALKSINDMRVERREYKRALFKRYLHINLKLAERKKNSVEYVNNFVKLAKNFVNDGNRQQDKMYYKEVMKLREVKDHLVDIQGILVTIVSIAFANERVALHEASTKLAILTIYHAHCVPELVQEWALEISCEPTRVIGIDVGLTRLIWVIKHLFTDNKMTCDSVAINQDITAVISYNGDRPTILGVSPLVKLQKKWSTYFNSKVVFPSPCRHAFIRWGDVTALAIINRRVNVTGATDFYNITLLNPDLKEDKLAQITLDACIQPYGVCSALGEGLYFTDVQEDKFPSIYYVGALSPPRVVFKATDRSILVKPTYLCVNIYDEIIVTDEETKNIVSFDSNGNVLAVNSDFYHPFFRTVGGVCTDAKGFIYVTNAYESAVYRFTRNLKVKDKFLCREQGCLHPMDVKLYGPRMFVACIDCIRVFAFDY